METWSREGQRKRRRLHVVPGRVEPERRKQQEGGHRVTVGVNLGIKLMPALLWDTSKETSGTLKRVNRLS